MHLFAGSDDVALSKMDSVFDSIVYDNETVGIDLKTTIELHLFGGALALAPLTCICALLNGEIP